MGGYNDSPQFSDVSKQIAPVQNLPTSFQDISHDPHIGEAETAIGNSGFSDWLKKTFNISIQQFMSSDPDEILKMMENMTA